jgi:hypothetical protein
MVLSQGIRALYETTHNHRTAGNTASARMSKLICSLKEKEPAADLFVKPIKEKGGVI